MCSPVDDNAAQKRGIMRIDEAADNGFLSIEKKSCRETTAYVCPGISFNKYQNIQSTPIHP